MQNKIIFDDFQELIQSPLEKDDPQSFEFIKMMFLKSEHSTADPFRFLIYQLINKKIKGPEAKEHWQSILRHKADMEKKLCRRVGISVAALDYSDTVMPRRSHSQHKPPSDRESGEADTTTRKESILDICSPGNHLENLKKEMFRAKRYKHSLSVIMLDIDNLQTANHAFPESQTEEALIIIAKIIKKTIRIVDIFSSYAENKFLIILPNTNKREAAELAERIRQNICERTKRIMGLADLIPTISVGQTMSASTSFDFMNQLGTALEDGKKRKCNMVYAL
jgi:diguanylate cyclase (GGDEF)-like protein